MSAHLIEIPIKFSLQVRTVISQLTTALTSQGKIANNVNMPLPHAAVAPTSAYVLSNGRHSKISVAQENKLSLCNNFKKPS